MAKIKLICYYVFGITIGKLVYPKSLFMSQFFCRPGSQGWRWLYQAFWNQKIRGFNRHCPWPCSPGILISNGNNIHFDVDDINNFFSNGIYFQDIGDIYIGKGTFIGPNVGLITENHDVNDPALRGGGKTNKNRGKMLDRDEFNYPSGSRTRRSYCCWSRSNSDKKF